MSHNNPYTLLDVSVDAGMDEILSAFRDRVRDLGHRLPVTNPEYGKQLAGLRQAVSVLTDPERRKQVDAGFARLDGPLSLSDVTQLWRMVCKLFFERTQRYSPAFDALRASVPITLENDALLIVGVDPAQQYQLGFMTGGETRATLKALLQEVSGRALDFRAIPHTTLQAWITLRDAEAARASAAVAAPEESGPSPSPLLSGMARRSAPPSRPASGADDWEEVMEALMRIWADTGSRSFPQVRAQLIINSLELVAKAEAGARAKGFPEDRVQRALARALGRIGSLTGSDSALIGVLYLHLHPQPAAPGTDDPMSVASLI